MRWDRKRDLCDFHRQARHRFACVHQEDPKDTRTSPYNSKKTRQGRWTHMSKITALHQRWLKTPGYEAAFEESLVEFELARQLIETRVKSGLGLLDELGFREKG